MSAVHEPDAVAARTQVLFAESQNVIHRQADRLFANLMIAQWLAGIAAAVWISPKTWIGATSQTHWHVWAAIFLGGTISGFPVLLAWKRPGQVLTRHVIAVAQMFTSALLIHLTGGRLETHFHVFGSLAFFAFYRDWRVLLTATIVVALDHMLRGIFWPLSAFGVLTTSPWRWIEHAGWVVFEDTFLFISIRQSMRDMLDVATRRASLEAVNASIERQVVERTAELTATHLKLVEASRQAGMAEVATSVLHNVGNVLNSVNVSATVVSERIRKSERGSIAKVVALLREHEADLGTFLGTDAKGKQVVGFLAKLAEHLAAEQTESVDELKVLQTNIDHIKDVIAMQQSYAKVTGVTETLQIADLVEDTLRMSGESLARHDVKVVREFAEVPEVTVDKHKLVQILVNLVRNAKQSCGAAQPLEKLLTLRIANGGGSVKISVSDNGLGIAPENLMRIFNHGFTTKKDGHGFGLHSGANAAREMGGSLFVQSAGVGRGATFTVELPLQK